VTDVFIWADVWNTTFTKRGSRSGGSGSEALKVLCVHLRSSTNRGVDLPHRVEPVIL
jgi:hypothetical protein